MPIVVMAHGLSGTRRDGLGPFAERFAAAGRRRARLRPPRLRRQRRRTRPLPPRASSRTGGRRSPTRARCRASIPSASPPSAPRWAAATRSPRRRRTAGRSRDQPGAVPRHGAPGAPLLAPRHRADAARRRPRPAPARGRPAARGGLHQRARRRGGLAPGRRRRRGLALARPRLRALAARPPLPTGPPAAGCTAPGCSVSARLTGSPSRPGDRGGAAGAAGELRTYPGVDHFDIYDGAEFEAVVADEVAFLRRHLLAPAEGRVSSRSGRSPFSARCWW